MGDDECYVCLEDGGERVCDCSSRIHLHCQKKLVRSLYYAGNMAAMYKCTVCKQDYTNVTRREARIVSSETVCYVSFWATMTVVLPLTTLSVHAMGVRHDLLSVLLFFTAFAYVISIFHLLMYMVSEDSFYSVVHQVEWTSTVRTGNRCRSGRRTPS